MLLIPDQAQNTCISVIQGRDVIVLIVLTVYSAERRVQFLYWIHSLYKATARLIGDSGSNFQYWIWWMKINLISINSI